MLQKIMDTVDTNGDGKIQYEGREAYIFWSFYYGLAEYGSGS